jgi:hypothetical protein
MRSPTQFIAPVDVESDATLMLAERGSKRYSELPRPKSQWNPTKKARRVMIEMAAEPTDDLECLFSDTEANDLVSQKSKELCLTDLCSDADVSEDDLITVAISQVVFGRRTRTLEQDYGGLRFVFGFTLDSMGVRKNSSMLFAIDGEDDIEKVYYTDTDILFLLHKDSSFGGSTFKTFMITMSASNAKKLINLFNRLKQSRLKIEKMSKIDMNSQITPLASDRFRSKTLSSLSSNPRLRSYGKPRPPAQKSSVVTAPTSTKSFYQPALVDNLPPPRRLRSTTKDYDHITIDDEIVRPKPRKKPEHKPFHPELYYVFEDQSSLKISDSDFRCLYTKQWINDTLIDFFLKYFTQEMVRNNTLSNDDFHVLTTFFFTKLVSTKDHYQNIQRWVSKLDLLKKNFVILPINESLHWYCAIIHNLSALLGEGGDCTIYVFDSLAQTHNDILEPIRDFLIGYAKEKYDLDVDPERIKLRTSQVPRQPNFNDCGVHVIYNVYRFLTRQDQCLALWNMDKVGRGNLREVFNGRERDEWRSKLRETLLELQKEMIAREGYVPDEEDQKHYVGEGDEDDVVFLDPDEFHRASKEGSVEALSEENGKSESSKEEDKEKPCYRDVPLDEGIYHGDLMVDENSEVANDIHLDDEPIGRVEVTKEKVPTGQEDDVLKDVSKGNETISGVPKAETEDEFSIDPKNEFQDEHKDEAKDGYRQDWEANRKHDERRAVSTETQPYSVPTDEDAGSHNEPNEESADSNSSKDESELCKSDQFSVSEDEALDTNKHEMGIDNNPSPKAKNSDQVVSDSEPESQLVNDSPRRIAVRPSPSTPRNSSFKSSTGFAKDAFIEVEDSQSDDGISPTQPIREVSSSPVASLSEHLPQPVVKLAAPRRALSTLLQRVTPLSSRYEELESETSMIEQEEEEDVEMMDSLPRRPTPIPEDIEMIDSDDEQPDSIILDDHSD